MKDRQNAATLKDLLDELQKWRVEDRNPVLGPLVDRIVDHALDHAPWIDS